MRYASRDAHETEISISSRPARLSVVEKKGPALPLVDYDVAWVVSPFDNLVVARDGDASQQGPATGMHLARRHLGRGG